MEPATYDERLRVPLRWWVQGTMLVASMWLAMIVVIPALLAWGFTLVLTLALVAALGTYGAARITVHGRGPTGVLRVGRARVEGRHLGAAVALDAEATRRTAGRDADARAYLVLRPFLKRAVRVPILDPADPVPYWLVSTRHPERLVDALSALAGQPERPGAVSPDRG